MRCNFERLIAYLNNELGENRKRDVLAHLHECDICLEAVLTMLQDRQNDHQALKMSQAELAGLMEYAEMIRPTMKRAGSGRYRDERNYVAAVRP